MKVLLIRSTLYTIPSPFVSQPQGVYRYANGDVYDGTWKDDEKNGIGRQTFSNIGAEGQEGGGNGAEEWYEGQWKDGRIQGKGKSIVFR